MGEVERDLRLWTGYENCCCEDIHLTIHSAIRRRSPVFRKWQKFRLELEKRLEGPLHIFGALDFCQSILCRIGDEICSMKV